MTIIAVSPINNGIQGNSYCQYRRAIKSKEENIFTTQSANNITSSSSKLEEEKKKKRDTWIKIGIAAAAVATVVAGAVVLKKTGAFDKIKGFFKGEKLVDADNELFSFAKKHPMKAPGGVFAEDGLVITHITDHLPKDGYIETTRSAFGGARDSIHFAVNHGVTGHMLGDWSGKSYAVIMPMDGALNTAGNKFVGGVAADFYSVGRVKIPKGSVLVRHNASIPEGKYKISDISKIKELRGLKGVKLIETSAQNMKTTVDNVVQKLGYELKDTPDAMYWGNANSKTIFRDFKRFNKFLKAHGMIPMIHSRTPNCKTEMLIESIMSRATLGKGWTFVNNGETLYDAKGEALEFIKYIEKYARKTKYPLSFDLNSLRDIVAKSETPKEAVLKIKEIMGISVPLLEKVKMDGIKELNPIMQEYSLIGSTKMTIGGYGAAACDNATVKYLANPCAKAYNSSIHASLGIMDDMEQIAVKMKIEDFI